MLVFVFHIVNQREKLNWIKLISLLSVFKRTNELRGKNSATKGEN